MKEIKRLIERYPSYSDLKNKCKNPEQDLCGYNENQLKIIYSKYLKRDTEGIVVESPRWMFARIARTIAEPELGYGDRDRYRDIRGNFYDAMRNLEFLPGGRTIANAGTKVNNLSNCYVVPVEDSMEGIFGAVKTAALIQKRGGGVGYCFSTLRPKNSWVSGCNGIASGPISFMEVFDKMCGTIMQGNRRGAQMATFHVSHPDIYDFITCKDDLTKLTNFNISVLVDDSFMNAVKSKGTYDLVNPHTKKVVKTLDARELFNTIAQHAWQHGEPGLLFIDTANKHNTLKSVGDYIATNPCAEIWLLPYEVCNLGSINLDKMITDGKIDYDKIRDTVRLGIRFLDNVISVGVFPTKETTDMAQNTRRIGLGVMGFADMLYQLNVSYNSKEGRDIAESVMKFINDNAWQMSRELAKERGVFPFWSKSTFAETDDKVRHCSVTALAPTGTLSMLADTSGGCEPNFALEFERFSHSTGKKFEYINKHYKKAKEKGNMKKDVFVVSHDIKPRDHILMQAAFQKNVSNAVSKTINLPKDATIKEVEDAYILAWESGCKGCTVYRDGSRENQVLKKK